MSGIKAMGFLSGRLSYIAGLSGKLSVIPRFDPYIGDYNVTPQAFNAKILNTANRILHKDVVVTEVPYFETANSSNGTTAYIAKEV